MKVDDLEELKAGQELRLREEYPAAIQLYRFEVTVGNNGMIYLANKVDTEVFQAGSGVWFEVVLTDCWAWDADRPVRTLSQVRILTIDTVTVEDRKPA